MIQNIIALTIVFATVGYIIFAVIKNLTEKKTTECSGCSGCTGCELKNLKTDKKLLSKKTCH